MSLITIDKISSGMKLAKPIVNKFNQVLLPAGTILKENHISTLKLWNINTLEIINIDDEKIEEIPKEIYDLACEKIKERILWQPRNDSEKEIIDIAILNLAKKLSQKNRGDN